MVHEYTERGTDGVYIRGCIVEDRRKSSATPIKLPRVIKSEFDRVCLIRSKAGITVAKFPKNGIETPLS